MGLYGAYLNIIGADAPWWSRAARPVLAAMSVVYGAAVARRNHRFDCGVRRVHDVGVPVISVGNITTGGTGKTPLVMDLCTRLRRMGRRAAVVSRGYGSARGQLGDELTMVAERLPDAVCIANPDRVAGARQAVARGADVVLLDDGFQHRRLRRNLDIVVIDATRPFGYGRLLPRGLLREPPEALNRAHLIVLSRADLISAGQREELLSRLRSCAPQVPCIACRHQPSGPIDLSGQPLVPPYRRAVLFAAVGNPRAFVATVERMGIEPVKGLWWPDHHGYRHRDLLRVVDACRHVPHDVVLTTRKDAVKLRALPWTDTERLGLIDIGVEYLDRGEAMIDSLVSRATCNSTH